jgi:hypothetical protein
VTGAQGARSEEEEEEEEEEKIEAKSEFQKSKPHVHSATCFISSR